jgi:hypothetical protein
MAWAALGVACGSPTTGPASTAASDAATAVADSSRWADAGSADAGTAGDGEFLTDSAPLDSTTDDSADGLAGAGDGGVGSDVGQATPWGVISGACGGLVDDITSPDAAFRVNTWQFDPYTTFDPKPLRPGARRRYYGPNAGGSSKCSEVMSMQLLYACEGATTLKPEVEISYTADGSITDWLATMGGYKVGVSVTRAYKGPNMQTYTVADATALLTKKLSGINESTANVSAADKWHKQILHVWTLQPSWVPLLQSAWQQLDPVLRADTVVLVTIEAGGTAITADTCD